MWTVGTEKTFKTKANRSEPPKDLQNTVVRIFLIKSKLQGQKENNTTKYRHQQ